jgi:hypothetical protein
LARQVQVEQHDVGRIGQGHVDGFGARADRRHLVAAGLDQRLDHAPDRVLIFDDENPHQLRY